MLSPSRLVLLTCLFGVLALASSGCSRKAPESADAAFTGLAKAYLDDVMRLWPTHATYLGEHRFDGQLEDFSPPALAAAAATYEKHRDALQKIEPGMLSPSSRIDFDLIHDDIESSLFSLTRLKQHEWDPNTYNETLGFSALLLTLLDEKSDLWPARLESLLSRLRAVPRFLEVARQNLSNSSPTLIDFTIEQNDGNVAFFRDSLPPLFDRAPAIKAQLAEADAQAVAAMKDFGVWLKDDLRPRATRDWRLGKDLWTEKLRYTLQSDLTPEQILARADETLKRTRGEMLEIAEPLHSQFFPKHRHKDQGDERINVIVSEVIDRISRNHSTADSLFGDVGAAVEKVKTFIRQKQVITLPPDSDNLVIEPTPGFLNGLAVAFFNPPPALEPDLKKSYWISSVPGGGTTPADRARRESYLREYNLYGLQSLTIHEAFPGHYVQQYLAQHSPLLTVYKRVFESGTFVEGWAVLMEKIMFDAGYADGDPANLLMHKKISLRVPMNAILDARLHTEPRADAEADAWALDLMMRYGFQEETEARGKLRRAKVTSTQLSTYFVGFTELYDLYQDVKQKSGDRFVLREFTDRLASYGSLPPRMVRQQMLADLKL